MRLKDKLVASIVATAMFFSGAASAIQITDNSGFDGGDTLVTFNEVAMTSGTIVSDQFAAYGVTFDPNLVSEDSRTVSGFSGQSLANFSPIVNPFVIDFSQTVDAFGAYWEADTSNILTFEAFLGATSVESFSFTENQCCNTGTFLGFSDILFDSVRVTTTGSQALIMDNLYYSSSSVPAPAVIGLLSIGLVGVGAATKRRNTKH